MVQQVVARRDRGEHFTHRPRGGLLIGGAFRGRADHRKFGCVGQSDFLMAHILSRVAASRSEAAT